MATAVDDIISRVRKILTDEGAIRWTDAELILWLNDAQTEIVLYKPDAGAVNTTVTLATGTKQTLPSGGNRLLGVVRNMSAASSGTGGRVIRAVSREILDSQEPNWHDPTVTGAAAHGTTQKHYCYDEQDPTVYYVFPGVAGASYIEIIYSAVPTDVSSGEDIGVADIYGNAIIDYILYRAFQKEAEYSATNARADKQYGLFLSAVTGKSQLDALTSPNSGRGIR
jgi:hypothetical protein